MDFKIDELRGYFIRKTIGRRIEYHEEVESTNTEALHLAQQGAEEGTVVIAEAQSAGRRHAILQGDAKIFIKPVCLFVANDLLLHRQPVLFLILIKDGASILMPGITELPVLCNRVNIVPKDIQEFFVGHFCGVIDDLNRLRVSGPAG